MTQMIETAMIVYFRKWTLVWIGIVSYQERICRSRVGTVKHAGCSHLWEMLAPGALNGPSPGGCNLRLRLARAPGGPDALVRARLGHVAAY